MPHDPSLDHLIYDGMGYADGHGNVIGSVRPTHEEAPPSAMPDRPTQWVFERSSGYAGYRNIATGEWLYESEYLRKFGHLLGR